MTTDFPGDYEEINDLIVQPDGQLVAAGQADGGVRTQDGKFALARYLP